MAALVLSFGSLMANTQAQAQVVQADYDFQASGFVTPAGVKPPGSYNGIAPVGYYPSADAASACDSGACDSGGCDSYGGGSSGDVFGGGNANAGCGGMLGQLGGGAMACGGCGRNGCGACKGLSNLRHMCLFCRGAGCSACQLCQENGILGLGAGGLLGALSSLRPYSEAGLCAQRWYDLSLEVMMLGHNTGSMGGLGGVTSRGAGGPIVLGSGDTSDGGLEPGFRLSGAIMMGAGANIEATWVGGHEWEDTASVTDAGFGLFSFISDFGNTPNNGFDDTDRSSVQSLTTTSEFDSVELNYRRRTVWPYCRFQGSWLVGLRYVGYDDGLAYTTRGDVNNGGAGRLRYFQSDDQTQNSMFGAQAGGDFWWNIVPGVSLGIGGKLGVLKNDIDARTNLRANSLGLNATPGTARGTFSDSDTTAMGEFEFKMVYRLSHSWTVRTSYYLLGIEDVAFGSVDPVAINQFVQSAGGSTPVVIGERAFQFDSLVNHGFSVGAEYVW
ncbi:BBP7 family outer membrane beta-barrel protein [Stieleria marina]